MKIIILLIIFNLFATAGLFDKKYDSKIKSNNEKFFFNYKHIYDYNIIKAQSYQESRFKQFAKSYVGATGLMQLMPKTYEGLKVKTGLKGSITDIDTNIAMGIYYDYKLFNQWKSKRTLKSRYQLMFASYNAGLGHLLNAQKKCIKTMNYYKVPNELYNCNEHIYIEAFLHEITGHHSKETKTYVKRIFKYYNQLKNN